MITLNSNKKAVFKEVDPKSKKEVNILHLSDIHFSNGTKIDTMLRDNILEKLTSTILDLDDSWKPDVVAISGDVAFSGDKSEYNHATKWIKVLLGKIGLSSADVFVCPGNHDIDRDAARTWIKQRKEKSYSQFVSEQIVFKKNIDKLTHNTFLYFQKFCNENDFNQFDHVEGFTDLKVFGSKYHEKTGLIFNVLNSAWLCFGHKSGSEEGPVDKENLLLSKLFLQHHFNFVSQMRDTLDYLTPSITLIHHPPDWLFWEERYRKEPGTIPSYEVIINNSDVILSGHEHALAKSPDYLANKAQLIIAGASFFKEVADGQIDPKYNFNSFNIIKINKHDKALTKREFYYNLSEAYNGEWGDLKMTDTVSFNYVSNDKLEALIVDERNQRKESERERKKSEQETNSKMHTFQLAIDALTNKAIDMQATNGALNSEDLPKLK